MSPFLIFWGIFSLLVALFASQRGKSFFGYFILSLLLSPLISFFIVMLTDSNNQKSEAKRIQSGSEKKCPYCAELVKAEAIKCKHCGSDIGGLNGNALADKDDLGAHKALQDAIYKKDEVRVEAILETKLSVADCPLAFNHKDYAELHGTPRIIKMIEAKS
ncbi:zinc ribbon domain-containing protein [Alteromonas sp.]|jgi:DNA-directed RNA polymerase subunit RPC12/RpoP|uniref:zinc ribbon domain-containing protein n=1 Tax=Alteromonas sp. TaxID=232 RepID=UPI00258078B5|nr:zinc ribbon domain-containing protein [Alteromonas sp.]|tara:strand:- start:13041 stop:13523 length:483 start_codon:yes stop_codon:yes gene_type:complete